MLNKKFNLNLLDSFGIKLTNSQHIDFFGDVEIESPVFCSSLIRFDTFIRIGAFSNLNHNTQIGHTSIGRYCSIAQNCFIGGDKHPTNWLSTSRLFYQDDFRNFGRNFGEKKINPRKFINTGMPTIIGNDVLIANSCIINRGLNIGNGSIIAPGSVVTKDVPAYAVVGGNPAKVIRFRFTEEVINKLEKLQWWRYNVLDFPHLSFDSIDKFIDEFESIKLKVNLFLPEKLSRENFVQYLYES